MEKLVPAMTCDGRTMTPNEIIARNMIVNHTTPFIVSSWIGLSIRKDAKPEKNVYSRGAEVFSI
jgi:hypothetical protein